MQSTAGKLAPTEVALAAGGEELDVAPNVGKVRSSDYAYVANKLAALPLAVHAERRKIKVNVEAGLRSVQRDRFHHRRLRR
jgi:deoxyribose-phosphate aldolase